MADGNSDPCAGAEGGEIEEAKEPVFLDSGLMKN